MLIGSADLYEVSRLKQNLASLSNVLRAKLARAEGTYT